MKLITVYGSLLEGLGNWNWCLKDRSEKLGEHVLEDNLVMVSFGGFPGLMNTHDISNRIFVETYRVADDVYRSIESLEGFRSQDHPSNFYNKKKINTPYGESEIYVLNRRTVSSGEEICHEVLPDENGIVNWRKYRMR
jgi:gamma-glutamylcyclotransferase (GGCT)/AIG2-like uncharacterized protein YtfP